ncbi:MAG: amidohydrolase family protein [Bacteroidota bacterium]
MKQFLLLLFGVSLSLNLWAQETKKDEEPGPNMDFEIYDPPSTLVVPENPVVKARYPFIDVHSHHWSMDEQRLRELEVEMDTMNMAIVVNLSGRGGAKLKAMQDAIEKVDPSRFVLFTNINIRSIDEPDWTQETLKQIEYDVANGAKGLKIYKSQGMTNTDNAGNRIRIDDSRIQPIFEKCGELGIPVLIHSADPKPFWQPHDENNERWLELKLRPRRKRGPDNPASWETIIAEQHNIFRQNPNTTFIAAHMGWFPNDLKKLGELLDEMPNMYVEIGAVIAELGRQPRMANRFFEKYQDRVLFGKDSYKPEEFPTYFRVLETADEYFPYYKKYHAFWKMYGLDLPDEILKKLYYKNALKIIPGLDTSLFPE